MHPCETIVFSHIFQPAAAIAIGRVDADVLPVPLYAILYRIQVCGK